MCLWIIQKKCSHFFRIKTRKNEKRDECFVCVAEWMNEWMNDSVLENVFYVSEINFKWWEKSSTSESVGVGYIVWIWLSCESLHKFLILFLWTHKYVYFIDLARTFAQLNAQSITFLDICSAPFFPIMSIKRNAFNGKITLNWTQLRSNEQHSTENTAQRKYIQAHNKIEDELYYMNQ